MSALRVENGALYALAGGIELVGVGRRVLGHQVGRCLQVQGAVSLHAAATDHVEQDAPLRPPAAGSIPQLQRQSKLSLSCHRQTVIAYQKPHGMLHRRRLLICKPGS